MTPTIATPVILAYLLSSEMHKPTNSGFQRSTYGTMAKSSPCLGKIILMVL